MLNRFNWKGCIDTGLQFSSFMAGAYVGAFVGSLSHTSLKEEPPAVPLFVFESMMVSVGAQIGGAMYSCIKSKLFPQSSWLDNYVAGTLNLYLPAVTALQSRYPYFMALQSFIVFKVSSEYTARYGEHVYAPYTERLNSLEENIQQEEEIISDEKEENPVQSVRKSFKERLALVNYQGDLPAEFTDCVEGEIMNNPYVLNSGQSLERETVMDIMQIGNKKCPITSKPITFYVANVGLRCAIERFVSDIEKAHIAEQARQSTAEAKVHKNGFFGKPDQVQSSEASPSFAAQAPSDSLAKQFAKL